MPVVVHDPTEYADIEFSGWTRSATTVITTTDQSRKWRSTYGGIRSLRGTNSTGAQEAYSPGFGSHAHLFGRVAVWAGEPGASFSIRMTDSSSVIAAEVRISNMGDIQIYRGASLIESSGVSIAEGRWWLLRWEIYQHDSTGVFKVWLDNELIIDFSGDTKDGTTVMDKLELGGEDSPYFDDIVVHNMTMRYGTEASGPFIVGEVITGTGGGAPTAVITALQDDGTTGVLTL